MITQKTTKEITDLHIRNELGMYEVWVCLNELKKEINNLLYKLQPFNTQKEKEMFYFLESLCNSQEQKGITGLPEQKDYEKSPKSVSCEHKTTGEDGAVVNRNSLKSSPVQNPKRFPINDFVIKDGVAIQKQKKCTCKYEDIAYMYDKGLIKNGICGRCGGKL